MRREKKSFCHLCRKRLVLHLLSKLPPKHSIRENHLYDIPSAVSLFSQLITNKNLKPDAENFFLTRQLLANCTFRITVSSDKKQILLLQLRDFPLYIFNTYSISLQVQSALLIIETNIRCSAAAVAVHIPEVTDVA